MKTIFKICCVSLPVLVSISAYANSFSSFFNTMKGSYLFCVNEKNTYKWKWATKSADFYNNYKNVGKITSGTDQGTWLQGAPSLNKHFNIVLDVKHEFETETQAKQFCEDLKNICTKEHGPEYSLIGVSSYIIPGWGLISVKYNTQQPNTDEDYSAESEFYQEEKTNTKTASCPNWNFKDFPNPGGAKYDVERIVTNHIFSNKK